MPPVRIKPRDRRRSILLNKDGEHWEEKRILDRSRRRAFIYFEYKTFDILNLIYHVCPLLSNNVWRDNLSQLKKRWDIFTGKKIIAVSNSSPLVHPLEEVKRELNREAEFVEVPNDTKLRETISFKVLLEKVQSLDPYEITFYAHTKGNSTVENRLGSEFWRNAMYHYLLDNIEAVKHSFNAYNAVGTHILNWPTLAKSPFPTNINNKYRWMFAGTFFWFKNDAIFSNPDWSNILSDRYGAESWIGNVLPIEEACTLFQPFPVNRYPGNNPYDPAVYSLPIRG